MNYLSRNNLILASITVSLIGIIINFMDSTKNVDNVTIKHKRRISAEEYNETDIASIIHKKNDGNVVNYFNNNRADIRFEDGASLQITSDGYHPMDIYFSDVTNLDTIGITLYKYSIRTVERNITGIAKTVSNSGDIIVKCDKCESDTLKIKSGDPYAFTVKKDSTPPYKITYQKSGYPKNIVLVLTPNKDEHATIDVAFDDSSPIGDGG